MKYERDMKKGLRAKPKRTAMTPLILFFLIWAIAIPLAEAYSLDVSFLPQRRASFGLHRRSNSVGTCAAKISSRQERKTSLMMVDSNVIQGAGIAIAGLVAGVGLVAFTENIGERSKTRGGGLSDDMKTRITGSLMEDVEVSSVNDLGSLTGQLEAALKETGAKEDFEVSEERKKQIEAEADDGW